MGSVSASSLLKQPALTLLAVILLVPFTAYFLFSLASGLPGSRRTNELLRINNFIIEWTIDPDSEEARWHHFQLSKSFISFSPTVFKAEIIFGCYRDGNMWESCTKIACWKSIDNFKFDFENRNLESCSYVQWIKFC